MSQGLAGQICGTIKASNVVVTEHTTRQITPPRLSEVRNSLRKKCLRNLESQAVEGTSSSVEILIMRFSLSIRGTAWDAVVLALWPQPELRRVPITGEPTPTVP
jgi:hypothetical protein